MNNTERTNRPLRFENLFPGSLFTIVAEPSRKIYKSRDKNIYRKAVNGFYAENVGTGAGCVLMPQDIVQRVLPNKKSK